MNEKQTKVLKVQSVLTNGTEELKSYINFIYVQEKPVVPETKLSEAGLKLSDHYGYTGEQKQITANYYLLYATNVNYTLDLKTTVYHGEEVVGKNDQQAILTPNTVNFETTVLTLDIKSDEQTEYRFVTELYDKGNLIFTSTDYYHIYDNPTEQTNPPNPDNPVEPEHQNVITQFNVSLNKYFLYTNGNKQEIKASCEMIYSFTDDAEITVKGYVMDGETELKSTQQKLNIQKDDTKVEFELISISDLDFSAEKQYIFKAELYDKDDNYIGERTAELKVKARPEIALNLTADTNTGQDYSIDLAWNDISNSDEQYGYRILRSSDDGKTWETRSTWNGSDSVSVLNIYPSGASNYLINWMNNKDPETNEPVGKGLFNIDTVYIGDYNKTPDDYLKSSDGSYKYDVLMFGTSDCNSGTDLSELSVEATQKFIDSGRGVLFGHDTICMVGGCYHPQFSKFADQTGIKATGYSAYSPTTSVNVVNEGFLTSFPWNITGTLTVPATHTTGQYSGGTLKGTVWMKFANYGSYNVDTETGGTNDAYLVTNNQIGMIQTGHSNGRATVDECKVFANTLFYLKQLTSSTGARDNSFYDITAPEKPSVNLNLTQYAKNNYSLNVTMTAKDSGTKYHYRAEGLAKSGKENVLSNTVVSEAFADMKGFVAIADTSSDSAKDRITYESDGKTVADVIVSTDGKADYTMNNLKKGQKYYLHIFAVDNENNVSEEYIKEICDSEEILSQADINSTLTCDKGTYDIGENITFTATAYTTGTSLHATASLHFCDLNGNVIATVADNISTQLSSAVTWSAKYPYLPENIAEGRYLAILTWYIGGNVPVAQSKCLVKINSQPEEAEIKLSADVTQGVGYANTLHWNDINTDTDGEYVNTDFVITLDESGSMSGSRINNAKIAISNFIDQMNIGDRMSIVTFDYYGNLKSGFSDNKDELKEVTSQIRAGGGTSVSSGLNLALKQFAEDNNTAEKYNKTIILICDGDIDNCTAQVETAMEQNISIYTINVVNSDSSVLSNMASQTGGKYYYTNVVTDMSEIMQYIKLMNDNGEYYYQVQRDGDIIDAVTKTTYPDNKFEDKEAPEIVSVSMTATSLYDSSYNGYLTVQGKDNGTDYSYLVRAVDKNDELNVMYSNTVTATATSGLKGYAYTIDTVNEPEPFILSDEKYFTEGNGDITINLDGYERGVYYYLHIYAIDNTGNISNEYVRPLVIGNLLLNNVSLTTQITTDKESYHAGENAYLDITARTGFYKTFAKGVVEILDENNTVVDTIESNCIAEITSYEDFTRGFVWKVKDVVAGNYRASVKWFNGENLMASDTAEFTVIPDGNITDKVSTDKLHYTTDENICVSDDIFNNTTNSYKNNLTVNIDIINTTNSKTVTTISDTVSSFAGSQNTYSDYIKASLLGTGNYKAVSKIKDKENTVASSTAMFYVVDYTELSEEYVGNIAVENNTDKDKFIRYSVTNNGNKDGKDLKVIVKIFTQDGKKIDEIIKNQDIDKGQTIDFSELYNTEALPIDTYPVTLSIADKDGNEALLAESGFEINKLIQYTVTFVDDDGTVIGVQYAEYGNSVTAPANPVKESDGKYNYTFEGWDTDFTSVTKDLTVKAVYVKTEIPTQPPTQAPTQSPTETSTEIIPTEIPSQSETQVTTQISPQTATQTVTQAPSEKITSPATQPTEAPSQQSKVTNIVKDVVDTGARGTVLIMITVILSGFAVAFMLSKRTVRKKGEKEGKYQ